MWVGVCGALVGLTVGTALGQGFGLPVADTAAPVPQGFLIGTAGFTFSDQTRDLYGIRLTYAATRDIRIFADVGTADSDPGIQVGGVYAIPADLRFDLAFRGTVYRGLTDDFDITGIGAMALASTPLRFVGTYVYGGLGLDLKMEDKKDPWNRADRDTTLDPVISVGALVYATEQVSVYLEASHVDEFFIGAGARYQF
jgi:hypothetical protein